MKILKKEMREKGMTVIELSEKLGVSRVTLSNWMNSRFAPKRDNMKKLRALGFSLDCAVDPGRELTPVKSKGWNDIHEGF